VRPLQNSKYHHVLLQSLFIDTNFIDDMPIQSNRIMVTIDCQMLIGGVLLLTIAPASVAKMPQFSMPILLLTIYLALISSILFTIWSLMLKYHKPTSMTISKFSIPIFGTILSILILPEAVFTIELLLSLTLVSVGIIIVNLTPRTKGPNSEVEGLNLKRSQARSI